MRFSHSILALGCALVFGTPALAVSNSADVPHVHVQLVFPIPHVFPDGGTNNAGLYFKLEPGWHVYWLNPGDSGEPPRISWILPNGFRVGPLEFPAPARLPLGPLMDYGYENEVLFPFQIDAASGLNSGSKITLDANVNWLVCREVCIPEKAQLEEELDVLSRAGGDTSLYFGPDQDLWNRLANQVPQPLPYSDTAIFASTATGFRLTISTGQRETQAQFFPDDQNTVDNPAPQTVTATATGFVLDLKKDANLTASPGQLNGVVELAGGRNYEISATPGTVNAPVAAVGFSAAALARIVGLAFLGGLLLNLMPCVFPVLFLKGLSLCRSGLRIGERCALTVLFTPPEFWFRSGRWWRCFSDCARPAPLSAGDSNSSRRFFFH